ncbi:methyltransferase domain-containing protein [Candidatus Nitronereus thalassa]|uniref:Methyltransferase domain-containing protein n=1 Tax=Candidatus Nitronereus thalassa TaxID=3020898 RepID=A0ABU3K492_9BACT|nr:methyltransferase domain-containing protein [Candidatus Nitronereus thalassa]MDT7041209.1 methyltransferase domain-containing protein [Candidatus Nitronereus thalassa]
MGQLDTTTASYVMDDPREASRLYRKVDGPQWVETYFAEYMEGARNVLEVGCGSAPLLQAVAESFSPTRVVGIDMSLNRLQFFRSNQQHTGSTAHVLSANAYALPFPSGRFDVVYCRFLLEYLESPLRAIEEMVRVCRPNGRIILQDLDGQLLWHFPEDEDLEPLVHEVVNYLRTKGFDPFLGRKLFTFCHRATLQDVSVRVDSYHLIAGEIDAVNYELWKLKLDIALPQMVQALGNTEKAHEVQDRFLAYLKREDTLTYSVLFTVTGRKSCDAQRSSLNNDGAFCERC